MLVPAFRAAWAVFALMTCARHDVPAQPAPARSVVVSPGGGGRAGFTSLPADQTGVSFTNLLADRAAAANQVLQNGSGVALGDVDGDGRCDIYLCGLEGSNALFRNLGGWTFSNITAGAGVACDSDLATGAVLADVDGDGDLDLLVNSVGGGTRCFLNDGQAKFAEFNSGLVRKFGAMSMSLADIDGDGDLDLYVANYRTTTVRSTGIQVLNVNGRRMVRPEDRDQLEFSPEGRLLEYGERDVLYLNDGRGGFSPVSWTDGRFLDEDGKRLADAPRDWGLSVMLRDINGDGSPDIYVCNDFFTPDRIWINDGRGNFRAMPRLAMRNSSAFSMGVDFADINRDGFDDFMVLDMLSRDHRMRMRQRGMTGEAAAEMSVIDARPQVERNTLFLNRGNGTYAEIAQLAGVQASEWSWGVVFLDVDLDGDEDVLITNGHDFDTQDADTGARLDQLGPRAGKAGETLLQYPRLFTANVAFRNRGDLTFEEVGGGWGFNAVGVSHGIALGDLDDDGDLDVVVNNLNAAASLYRNDSAAPRVGVRLKGRGANTRGVGARIRLIGGTKPQSRQMISGGRYLSGDDAMRMFAFEGGGGSRTLEIDWRSGARSVVTNVLPDRVYVIEEPAAASPVQWSKAPAPAPLFEDMTAALGHAHRDEPFDDFARQTLLPQRMSRPGPGVSWSDLDGDGLEDLIVGAGRGGRVAFLRNDGRGGFAPLTNAPLAGVSPDDVSQVIASGVRSNGFALWTASQGYDMSAPVAVASGFREWSGAAAVSIGELGGSPGAMALCDVDGDGELDLFVGGRVVPGRYPEAGPSRLFRIRGGVPSLAEEWPGLGMVSGAVFSDLDGDGFAELILACEWGPLRVFKNNAGRLVPWDPAVTAADPAFKSLTALSQFSGWWNGVTTADFDGDGRLDIVASNWGRNHAMQEHARDGLRLLHGDIAERGSVEVVEAYLEPVRKVVVPVRSLDSLAQAVPSILERVRSYAAFGEASVEQIFGARLKGCAELRVNWLDSTVFLNRGSSFEARSLPVEAQFAPAFGIGAADFDGDGAMDLVLAQNFFGVNAEASRHDAGCGLVLLGDGRGGFRSLSVTESGVEAHGEQRGLAVADFDRDGRMDFALGQNAAATRLFRNRRGQPGVRVRVRGPAANPDGVGVVASLKLADGRTMVREIKGGAGYLSQDSFVLMFPSPAKFAGELHLRRPGGRLTKVALPEGMAEVEVDASGSMR